MHINRVDLNLLVVFDAIYSEGGITRAADKLHLTQPAVSHALGRLRDLFDDPLFERDGRLMMPTPKARSLIGTVRRSLRDLQIMFNDIERFDPATSERGFTVGMRDLLEVSVLPVLAQRMAKAAPTLKLASVRLDRPNLEAELATGVLDVAIDVLRPVSDDIAYQRTAQDRMVVLARPHHRVVSQGLTLEDYLEQDHIQLSSRRSGQSFEDLELSRLGIQRRIRLRCQNAFAALRIVNETDTLLTLAESYARELAPQFGLKVLPLPFKTTPFDAYLYWHKNVDNDPSNRWLREQIQSMIR
ncbi:DNA-binding transcriptional LysR family regulator [Litorivivens lipolytica]|uniref:DNA-binding transcriptional LysR family regulator n=1 Tax=Litorivivens lipolytica TaxID=1524264 RepID=A0A7W4W3W9_9GAMM|nr:LysR family transcriptional regulator [Litorivivens lipolytica]MBB3046987.1 DNA-binding transcriptional LysR family regulator [Litorivivens lipolytica]